MPFCPKCRYEYKTGVSKCPDCDEYLVDSLAQETDSRLKVYDNWVELGRLASQQYSEMLVEALRAKDIPAVVNSSAGHFGTTGQMGTAAFRPISGAYYSLMVPEEFAKAADSEAEAILGDVWVKARIE